MELPWDDDAVQRTSEVPHDEVSRPPREAPGLIRAGVAEDANEGVLREGHAPFALRKPEEVSDRLPCREELPALLQVQEDEGVKPPLEVLLDHVEG